MVNKLACYRLATSLHEDPIFPHALFPTQEVRVYFEFVAMITYDMCWYASAYVRLLHVLLYICIVFES